jgi:hypothetical protein
VLEEADNDNDDDNNNNDSDYRIDPNNLVK